MMFFAEEDKGKKQHITWSRRTGTDKDNTAESEKCAGIAWHVGENTGRDDRDERDVGMTGRGEENPPAHRRVPAGRSFYRWG